MARARAHTVISVQVVGDPASASSILERDDRIERVESSNGELMVTLRDPTMHHAFLVELLVSRNIALHSIAPHQLKLEDVFLRLTKGIVQ